MFWTDWVQTPSALNANIERANMDGSGRRQLVNKHLLWPNGLSIDYTNNRLYWCDAYTDRIGSIDIDTGLDQKVAVSCGFGCVCLH